MEETIKAIEPDGVYYWATHARAGIDLLAFKEGRELGMEFNRVDAPKITPSVRNALDDLKLDHIAIV